MTHSLKRILWLALRLAVVIGLVAWVLSKMGGENVVQTAQRLADHWGWAVAALGVALVQSPLGAIRLRMLLGVQGIHITFFESLRLTYIGWFFSNLPLMPGSTGGDFIKAYYIARHTHQKAEAVTIVFLDRFIGLIAMCMLGAAAVALSLSDERMRIAQIAIGVFLGGAVLGGLVFYSRRLRVVLHLSRLVDRLPVAETIRKIGKAIFLYRWHKGKVLLTMVYSWGAQAASVVVVCWLGIGLGSNLEWSQYFVIMPVIWIVSSFIPIPGAVGVAEAAFVYFFDSSVLGVPADGAAELAFFMCLANRLVMTVASLPGGVLYLLQRTHVSPAAMKAEMDRPEEGGPPEPPGSA